uniref:Uncharacterized protein n=1 Tax=Calidris pygmaea TaxID=425635 RepID=A0A8C3KFQ3_9CHAR
SITASFPPLHGKTNLCEEHQEPLKLFCQDDKMLICMVCDKSKVHRNHSVVPVGEAAQETYRKLHELLEKEESSFLAQLEQLDTEMMTAHEEIHQKLLDETMSLGTLIGEMERTYQQPDLELLKVRGRAFQTSLRFLPQSAPRGTSLKWDPGTSRGSIPPQMTLDPETANAMLYLSEDCKLVWLGSHEQDLPSNPERFKVNPCVLGSRGFTSGWHRWDVEICRDGVWAIGVFKESVPRKRFLPIGPEDNVCAVCHNRDGYKTLTFPTVTPLTLRSVPKRIRICLDCEKGRVVFFDAESKEQIFDFSQASFQGERVFPWFLVKADAQLKLLP